MQGTLRTQIEQLAGKLHFPLKKLYLMDGSKRSGHSNAYMCVDQTQGIDGIIGLPLEYWGGNGGWGRSGA